MSSIKEVLTPFIPDEQESDRFASFLSQIDRVVAGSARQIDSVIHDFQEYCKRQNELISPDDLQQVRQRLTLLLGNHLGFQRQRKAEHLADAIGNPLSTIRIICDLRPVFDPEHNKVEGSLIVITLRAVASGPDSLPVAFEARLTEKQLADLTEAATEAVKKNAVLKKLLAERQIPAPATKLSK